MLLLRLFFSLTIVVAWLALTACRDAQAASLTFTNATGDSFWSTPGNWDSGTVPTAADTVSLPASTSSSSNTPIIVHYESYLSSGAHAGGINGNQAHILVTAGSLTISADATAHVFIGQLHIVASPAASSGLIPHPKVQIDGTGMANVGHMLLDGGNATLTGTSSVTVSTLLTLGGGCILSSPGGGEGGNPSIQLSAGAEFQVLGGASPQLIKRALTTLAGSTTTFAAPGASLIASAVAVTLGGAVSLPNNCEVSVTTSSAAAASAAALVMPAGGTLSVGDSSSLVTTARITTTIAAAVSLMSANSMLGFAGPSTLGTGWSFPQQHVGQVVVSAGGTCTVMAGAVVDQPFPIVTVKAQGAFLPQGNVSLASLIVESGATAGAFGQNPTGTTVSKLLVGKGSNLWFSGWLRLTGSGTWTPGSQIGSILSGTVVVDGGLLVDTGASLSLAAAPAASDKLELFSGAQLKVLGTLVWAAATSPRISLGRAAAGSQDNVHITSSGTVSIVAGCADAGFRQDTLCASCLPASVTNDGHISIDAGARFTVADGCGAVNSANARIDLHGVGSVLAAAQPPNGRSRFLQYGTVALQDTTASLDTSTAHWAFSAASTRFELAVSKSGGGNFNVAKLALRTETMSNLAVQGLIQFVFGAGAGEPPVGTTFTGIAPAALISAVVLQAKPALTGGKYLVATPAAATSGIGALDVTVSLAVSSSTGSNGGASTGSSSGGGTGGGGTTGAGHLCAPDVKNPDGSYASDTIQVMFNIQQSDSSKIALDLPAQLGVVMDVSSHRFVVENVKGAPGSGTPYLQCLVTFRVLPRIGLGLCSVANIAHRFLELYSTKSPAFQASPLFEDINFTFDAASTVQDANVFPCQYVGDGWVTDMKDCVDGDDSKDGLLARFVKDTLVVIAVAGGLGGIIFIVLIWWYRKRRARRRHNEGEMAIFGGGGDDYARLDDGGSPYDQSAELNDALLAGDADLFRVQ